MSDGMKCRRRVKLMLTLEKIEGEYVENFRLIQSSDRFSRLGEFFIQSLCWLRNLKEETREEMRFCMRIKATIARIEENATEPEISSKITGWIARAKLQHDSLIFSFSPFPSNLMGGNSLLIITSCWGFHTKQLLEYVFRDDVNRAITSHDADTWSIRCFLRTEIQHSLYVWSSDFQTFSILWSTRDLIALFW